MNHEVKSADRDLTNYLYDECCAAPDTSSHNLLDLSLFLYSHYSLQSLRPRIALIVRYIFSNFFQRVLVRRPYFCKGESGALLFSHFFLVTLFFRFLDEFLDIVIGIYKSTSCIILIPTNH